MTGGFNPLQNIAFIVGSLAGLLPPLPAPPFPLSTPPSAESPSSLAASSGRVDVLFNPMQAGMENYRAEQEKRGIILLHYE